jgi:hypothetical protein
MRTVKSVGVAAQVDWLVIDIESSSWFALQSIDFSAVQIAGT